MSTSLVPHSGSGVLSLPEEQQARILQTLSLDVRSPLTQALLLVADRYDLDPLLKQVQIIKGNVYITHAGLLHIAHASGKLDGIVVEEEGVEQTFYWARVTVYRNDMRHGFTYKGEFPKSKVRSDGASGREMALKNAERSALRRAFDIAAPTMDESGTDFDQVEPHGDIDLPPGKPALPDAGHNAIDVPAPAALPAPPALPVAQDIPTPKAAGAASPASAPAVEAAPRMPEGTVKVAFPETGEIVHLSPNGHLVNPATGGEQFAATPEQEALQARAREIAAAAQEPKPAPKARKTTAKKAAPAPAPKEDGDEGYSEAQIKRAQSVHMSAKDCGVDEVLLRDFVRYVTTDDENPEGRTTSTREVTQSEADLLRNIFVGVRDDKIEFRYDDKGHITGVSGISFSPPEEEAPATNGEAKDWKAIATECGLSEARLLRKAREMANEIGVPLPARSAEIGDGELGALLVKWIAEEVNI